MIPRKQVHFVFFAQCDKEAGLAMLIDVFRPMLDFFDVTIGVGVEIFFKAVIQKGGNDIRSGAARAR